MPEVPGGPETVKELAGLGGVLVHSEDARRVRAHRLRRSARIVARAGR
jgi:hypothetical protein